MCDAHISLILRLDSHSSRQQQQSCRPPSQIRPSKLPVGLNSGQDAHQRRGYVRFIGMGENKQRICTYYHKTGRCRYGDACRYSHSSPSMEQTAGFQDRVWSHQQVRSFEATLGSGEGVPLLAARQILEHVVMKLPESACICQGFHYDARVCIVIAAILIMCKGLQGLDISESAGQHKSRAPAPLQHPHPVLQHPGRSTGRQQAGLQ